MTQTFSNKKKTKHRCSCGTLFILKQTGNDLDTICIDCVINAKDATCIDCGTTYSIFPFHDNYDADWSNWTCNSCLSSDDDSIEVVFSHNPLGTVCPITMETLSGRVRKSRMCQHVYSSAGIEWHIDNGRKVCPVAGCQHKIKRSYLVWTNVKASAPRPKTDVIVIDLT